MFNLETAQRCLNIAKGCHDYGGGYREKAEQDIYHHGIQTAINCLEKFVKLNGDIETNWQLRAVENIGKNT
uniref:Uncharacterized protein n=1 Tax=viral metagenome TaxID=1070528 RepID=A0A6M3JFN6_9ZZZZ